MKTIANVIALTALAAVVAADQCDYSVVGPTLQGLADPIADCMADTGYNIANYTLAATEAQKEALCDDCTSLIDALNELTWPDCTMEMLGENITLTEYFSSIIGDCSTAGSQYTSTATTASSSSSSASSSGSALEVGTPTPTTATDSAATATVSAVALVVCSLAVWGI